jgi:N-methylhydantoinase A
MAREMRVLTVQRGIDPREFSLVAFGGSGPVHGVDLARELEMKEVIVPPTPGVTSAAGLLVADTRYDRVRTVLIELSSTNSDGRKPAAETLRSVYAAMEADVRQELTHTNDAFRVIREVEMRYLRQGHELRVVAPDGDDDLKALEHAFYRAHQERFGYALEDEPTLIVNALLTMTLPAQVRSVRAPAATRVEVEGVETRSVVFDGMRQDVKILAREAVPGGREIDGPLIIEQTDTTVVVPPQSSVVRDESDNLIVSLR